MGEWFLTHFLPAAAVTYAVVGSEPLAAWRAVLRLTWPRTFGRLFNCAPCFGLYAGLAAGAWRWYLDGGPWWEHARGALACVGALWVLSAVTGMAERIARALESRDAPVVEQLPPMPLPEGLPLGCDLLGPCDDTGEREETFVPESVRMPDGRNVTSNERRTK